MKHPTLLASALLALTAPAAAQWAGDNFDSYADGTSLQNVGGWKGWDGVAAAAGTVSSVRKLSAPHGMLCGPTTDAVHPNIGVNCGKWTFIAHQRITLGDLAGGDVFVILNNVYNDGGPYTWTVEISASNSTSTVQDDFVNGTTRVGAPLPVVYDRWVQIRCDIDLDADTIDTYYDGQLLSSGTYTISGGPAVVENIDLFSAGGTCFYDDIMFVSGGALNEFDVFPGPGGTGVSSVSRGNFGTGEGSLFQGYPPSHFRGIGDSGASSTLHQFWYIIQDQDISTQDPYSYVVRSGSAGGPTLGASGLMFQFSTVTPFNGAGGGGAWAITLTLGTPLTIPSDDHFFVGWQFPPAPNWPGTDGPSPQLRSQASDAELAGQPHHAWQFIGDPNAGSVSQTSGRVWCEKLRTPAPVLNVGSVGTVAFPGGDFGATGMYTKVGMPESLGIQFRIRDASNANGNAIVLFGTAYDPNFPLCTFGIQGNLWLTTGLIGQLWSTPLDAAGEAIGGPAWMGAGMLHRFGGSNAFVLFQALTFSAGPSQVRASNGAGTRMF